MQNPDVHTKSSNFVQPRELCGLETPLIFSCNGARLLGILHRACAPAHTGVVVVVGGPQYRIGSHRQFVLLARELARNGIAVLRFDYRGMGDSEGGHVTFEGIDADIASAIDALCAEMPELRRIVLWGLCDAASAAMFYASTDPRVAGMVLLNPWIRGAVTQAKTYLRHYYTTQLKDPQFWRRMLGGRVSLSRASSDLIGNLSLALRPTYQSRGKASAPNREKKTPFPE